MKAAFFLVFATGCALLHDAEAPSTGGLFPHEVGYANGTKHGADALRLGEPMCATCHVEDAQVTPTCASCHDFPHPQGWRSGEAHGDAMRTNPGLLDPCAECHSHPGLVATDEVGCGSCHASYPHPEDWEMTSHGPYVVQRQWAIVETCGTCHGPDLTGGAAEIACASCHAVYPHPSGWRERSAHGVAATAVDADCTSCHGPNGDGGGSGVACSTCHAAYPHPSDWDTTHLGPASRAGEPTCMSCHQPGDGPTTMVATCSQECHAP